MTSTTDWDALKKRLDQVKKPVRVFKLCEDPDLRDRYLKAKQAAEMANASLEQLSKQADKDARSLVQNQAVEANAELAQAQQAYDDATIILRFQALEQQELEELQAEHKPSEEEEANGYDFAFDTFAPALIAAASLDGMPVEYAAKCLKTWPPQDATGLWQAAWSVQHVRRTDLGKG